MEMITIDPACLPKPHSADAVAHGWESWETATRTANDPTLADFMAQCRNIPPIKALLESLFGNSPYLTHSVATYPLVVRDFFSHGPDSAFTILLAQLPDPLAGWEVKTLMKELRRCKTQGALLIAMADITQLWPLTTVTAAMSKLAELSVDCAVNYALLMAARKGDIILPDMTTPSRDSGFIVLGMGKLGAYELNYSSDIDLIVFYEPERLSYRGRRSERECLRDVVQEIVDILQQRTQEGYVFRTDLRLRPDPASTPPAISTEAALRYYEGVGQNWERAAMIKARPIAGDLVAGEQFLIQLKPFIWRKHLDFAALNDILSIKRQMDSRTNRELVVPGHNIKIGYGGIREIELFAQVHQLIWGGHMPALRTRSTCETLDHLTNEGLVSADTIEVLKEAYPFLRTLEHRLQMVADQQTHSIPATSEELARIASFCGYADTGAFTQAVFDHAQRVHDIFIAAFASAMPLGEEGNLVFTGVSHDPETIRNLTRMGYKNPENISAIIMGWHRGSRRCTRTRRARQVLTELMPKLLKRLSETVSPDAAFMNFDAFLVHMPAGVQLFSLFSANPPLLGLVADIMGSAPLLAETLSRHPDLIESVLYPGFFDALPDTQTLSEQRDILLAQAEDFEAQMESLRRFKNEKQFQAGVQLLKSNIDTRVAGQFLSRLADVLLTGALTAVEREFNSSYGCITGGAFCVLGLGRLGSQELTFGSDLDLVFVYSAPSDAAISDGAKSFNASVYYNRFTQRYLSALTAIGQGGRLYEVDTRLRPSGTQGLPAVSLTAMHRYFEESAWTFEYMALTRARPVAGDASLQNEIAQWVNTTLTRRRDQHVLRKDALAMRERVAATFPANNPWDVKHTRGGLMDIDFICQYLLLSHAPQYPDILARTNEDIILALKEKKLLNADIADRLLNDFRFLTPLFHMLRLSLGKPLDTQHTEQGLKVFLARAMQLPDFETLTAHLDTVEKDVQNCYAYILNQGDTHENG